MKTVNLEPLHLGAEVRAASFDKETNSVECIWTTGAAVTRRGPSGYYSEELTLSPGAVRLGRLNAGAPLLDSHNDRNLSQVIGSVVPGSAKIVGGKGVARIKLSTSPGDADNVEKIKSGIVRNISVGYAVHRIEIVERDGDIPIYSVVDWEPHELSAVAIPADAGAQFRAATRSTAGAHAAQIVTLEMWSPKACRIRMLAAQRRVGMFSEDRAFQS